MKEVTVRVKVPDGVSSELVEKSREDLVEKKVKDILELYDLLDKTDVKKLEESVREFRRSFRLRHPPRY